MTFGSQGNSMNPIYLMLYLINYTEFNVNICLVWTFHTNVLVSMFAVWRRLWCWKLQTGFGTFWGASLFIPAGQWRHILCCLTPREFRAVKADVRPPESGSAPSLFPRRCRWLLRDLLLSLLIVKALWSACGCHLEPYKLKLIDLWSAKYDNINLNLLSNWKSYMKPERDRIPHYELLSSQILTDKDATNSKCIQLYLL